MTLKWWEPIRTKKSKGSHPIDKCPNCGSTNTYAQDRTGKRYCRDCKKSYYVIK